MLMAAIRLHFVDLDHKSFFRGRIGIQVRSPTSNVLLCNYDDDDAGAGAAAFDDDDDGSSGGNDSGGAGAGGGIDDDGGYDCSSQHYGILDL